MNFVVAMLPFPVNLGESYSVRIHLSMDFVRRIKSFRRQSVGISADGAIMPFFQSFSFGRLSIQTLIHMHFAIVAKVTRNKGFSFDEGVKRAMSQHGDGARRSAREVLREGAARR